MRSVDERVPGEEEESEDAPLAKDAPPEVRQSIQIQAKLARIAAIMGLKVWIPRADRAKLSELLSATERLALLEDLPINKTTQRTRRLN